MSQSCFFSAKDLTEANVPLLSSSQETEDRDDPAVAKALNESDVTSAEFNQETIESETEPEVEYESKQLEELGRNLRF